MAAPATDLLGAELARVLDCAVDFLSTPAPRAFINPGLPVSYDWCCDGGQVWSRVITIQPINLTGQSGATRSNCGVGEWEAILAIGVLRCAATVDDRGDPPSPDELTADAIRMTQDCADLQAALLCCIQPYAIVGWLPLGVEGGCVGGEWSFRVRLGVCPCPN